MNISSCINSGYTKQANNNSTPNFTSRNKILRELSDIGTLTRREFPVYSNTKIERDIKNSSVYNLFLYAMDLIRELRGFARFEGPEEKTMARLIDGVKRLRVGNCGELANAGYIACKMNGIKNVRLMSLGKYNLKSHSVSFLDHSVVGINFTEKSRVPAERLKEAVYMHDKDGIIMDNWCGFVDYASNAGTKYKADKVWGKELGPDERFCYIDIGPLGDVTEKDLLYFERTYPNLMKGKNKNIRQAMEWTSADQREYQFKPIPRSLVESCRRNARLKNAMSQRELSELMAKEVEESEKSQRLF